MAEVSVNKLYGAGGPARIIKVKKRSENWSYTETRTLLNLWKENLMDLRRMKRNYPVYEKISSKLADAGILRSVEEIRAKITNLTSEYRKERSRLGTSNGPSSWKYYSEVHKIIGSLPSRDVPPAKKECEFPQHQVGGFTTDSYSSSENLSEADGSPEDGENVENGTTFKTEKANSCNDPNRDDPILPLDLAPPFRRTEQTRSSSVSSLHEQQLQLMREMMAEHKRCNVAAERHEAQMLELMREQLSIQKQSLLLQTQMIAILGRLCPANATDRHVVPLKKEN